MEPVDTSAVDDGRELAGTHSQRGTDRREAQDHLELSPHTIDEEGPAVLLSVLDSCPFHFISDPVDDIFQFIVCKEVRDFSGSQQVVDDHQELLIWNLGIGEEEDYADVLEACLDVELS